ncbi:hypothetical protein DL98DRAFT_662206 [Cadophora sp. DSE1049]|nr:hypothetical protein DL98DRAFT_662206 [Cadophora sp. DSE1049]
MPYDPDWFDVNQTYQHASKPSSLAASKAGPPWKLTATLTTPSNTVGEDAEAEGSAKGEAGEEVEQDAKGEAEGLAKGEVKKEAEGEAEGETNEKVEETLQEETEEEPQGEAEVETHLETRGELQGVTEREDTRCNETNRASQDTSTADQDIHDKKRRKISEYPHVAVLHDIGELIAAGGTGLVYQYQKNLVLKIYKDAKTFHNELRAYLQISASPLFDKAPRFAKQVLLPECFLRRRFTNHQRGDLEFQPYSFGLILQQLNGSLLSEHLDGVCPRKPWLNHLEESIKTVLQDLHDIGISHADVKSNNFILHTREWTTNNFEKDCFAIDFGEAVFQSDCSPNGWKEQCQVDLIDASLMFAIPRAQLAITSLTQWLHPHCVSQSSHKHNSGDLDSLALVPPTTRAALLTFDLDVLFPKTDTTQLTFDQDLLFPKTDITQLTFEQEHFLISTLRAAAALPVKAIPLVNVLVKRISSPSLPLIEIIIEIFCNVNKSKAAIKYIDKQLTPSCIRRRPMQSQNAITVSLYQRKIQILREHNYRLAYRIKTLQAAVCFSEKHFQDDVIDILTLEWRRELSLTLYNQGEVDQARSLYNTSLQVLNKERDDLGDERTDSGDDIDQKDIGGREEEINTGGRGDAHADARGDAREDARENAKWILRGWAQALDDRNRVAEVRRSRGFQ